MLWFLIMLAQARTPSPTAAPAPQPGATAVSVSGIDIAGLTRTRASVVLRQTGLDPHGFLTSSRLLRAERRVGEIPAIARATFRAASAGSAATPVRIAVEERHAAPDGAMGWAAVAVRSVFARELRLDIAGLTHAGDLITPAYRWAANRPGVEAGIQVPAPPHVPGIAAITASWERASYSPTETDGPLVQEERTRVSGVLSNWATSWFRWQGGGGFDRINARDYASVDANLNARFWDDRIAVIGAVGRWTSTSAGPGFANGQALVMWRSARETSTPTLTVTAGVAAASADAPLAVWPASSSSSVRGELLRAHTLFAHGVIVDPVLGRRLAFGNIEYERLLAERKAGALSGALFLDTARAWKRRDQAPPSDLQIDLGAGIRFSAAGLPGKVRIDAAVGLRDGAHKLSAGYAARWGRTR